MSFPWTIIFYFFPPLNPPTILPFLMGVLELELIRLLSPLQEHRHATPPPKMTLTFMTGGDAHSLQEQEF